MRVELKNHMLVLFFGKYPVMSEVVLSRFHTKHRNEKNSRLSGQVAKFEERYSLGSKAFYARYKSGEAGNDTDFVEWASTLDMIVNIDKKLFLLKSESDHQYIL